MEKSKTIKTQIYWVYILECENGSLYTGYTNNLDARIKAHYRGTSGCKFTKSFKPKNVAQVWELHGDRAFAMRVERSIKKLTKKQKRKFDSISK